MPSYATSRPSCPRQPSAAVYCILLTAAAWHHLPHLQSQIEAGPRQLEARYARSQAICGVLALLE